MHARRCQAWGVVWLLRALAGLLALSLIRDAGATDPARGARLFASVPAPGELACADCHSENPVVNNFGNIWSGRNAVALIARAVNLNTGGMGVFSRYYGAADLADIAAYLGNTPAALVFAETPVGQASVAQRITISASSKTGLDGLTLDVQGDFQLRSAACPAQLPAFGSCEVELVFTPVAGGARSGSLRLAHSGLPTPAVIELSGSGRERPPAIVELSTSALSFDATAVGVAGEERQVRLFNRSADAVTLGTAMITGSDDFIVSGGTCHGGQVLTAGQACVLALRMRPGAPGQRAAQLVLPHDGVGAASVVALSGQSLSTPMGRLVLEPPALNFGTLAPGRVGPVLTVRLRNEGNAELPWRAGSLSQPGFGIEPGGCAAQVSLAPGASCELALRFRPPLSSGAAGAPARVLAAELPLLHEGSGAHRLVVWGTAAGPTPAVVAATAPTAALWVDAAHLAFQGTAERRVSVVNRSAVPLPITGLALIGTAAAEVVRGGSCAVGLMLLPGAGCELVLAFATPATRPRSASLLLSAPQDALLLSLQALSAAAGIPPTPPIPATLAWHDDAASRPGLRTDVGAVSPSLTMRLHNPGLQAVTLQGLALAGAAASEFGVVGGNCQAGLVLQGGASCTAALAFAPAVPGERQAVLSAQVDDLADALLPLQAQGLAPAVPLLNLAPPALVFAVGPPGQGARQRVLLENRGAALMVVRGIGLQGSGYALLADDPMTCPPQGLALLPGQACVMDVQWSGGVAAAAGGRVVIDVEGASAPVQLPLSVVEDAAGRSNVGGGGAMDPVLLVMLLLVCGVLAVRGRESAHA